MNKKLSITINLFKEIGENFYKDKYNLIKYSNDNIILNSITFYHNLANKNYFLVYLLFKDNETDFDLLGDFIIRTESQVQGEYTNNNDELPESIGVFDGVFDQIIYQIKKNLPVGKYDLAICAKEIESNSNSIISKIRKDLINTKDLTSFELCASVPFNVIS